MKRVLMAMTCGLITVSPASAAAQQVWDFCFAQLQQVRPALGGRGEWEAFMANCIADHTLPAERGPYKKPQYKKRR
jgi:hypothetical protein